MRWTGSRGGQGTSGLVDWPHPLAGQRDWGRRERQGETEMQELGAALYDSSVKDHFISNMSQTDTFVKRKATRSDTVTMSNCCKGFETLALNA